ncbi:hypothetical protein QBC39DRAFT_334248 [Podospora conica]|nr:hypothetical protein QBC39DRAFT_334248 [Schizothecium conicum]
MTTEAPPASIRLHITPLDPDLLKVVLSSTLLPKATAISYHALDTFPEKRYGFLNLPAEDAEKLRKKLNGAVVKGLKLRVQTARPEAIPAPVGEDVAMAKSEDKKSSKDKMEGKKRKRDSVVVLEGAQLEGGRKVKRGWTAAAGAEEAQDKDRRARKEKGEKKDKKGRRQEKSKFTDHEECLVKTVLPPNAVPEVDAAAPKSKKKRNAREVVVHEFEKTTKFPTFLKTTVAAAGARPELEFVEGKGWVDGEGAVVEPVKARPVTRSRAPIFKKPAPPVADSSSSSNGTDDDEESEAESTSASPPPKANGKAKDIEMEDAAQPEPTPSPQSDTAKLKSPKGGLSIRIPATPKDGKVHPLEALYKRPAPTDGASAEPEQPTEKPFSFFNHDNDEDASASDGEAAADATAANDDDEGAPKPQVLMTPFTRRDIETRGIRSAAPTPDTAHPSRRFKPWEDDDDDEVEAAAGEESPSGKVAATTRGNGEEGGAATSDFQKWFWENRGDINRSWKKRRKQAGKEKRYRDNRARMARAI